MIYRERRQAKAERLREWADKRDVKADAARETSNSISDMIPFGQPILVGHHSESRARRDADKIHRKMGESVEHARKAADFRRRADGIERAAGSAVYSDDEDAAERLRSRIESREQERARIKDYNTSCRKAERDLDLLDDRQRADILSIAKVAAYQLGKSGAFPSYTLSYLSASIRKDQKRLEDLI